MNSPVTVQYTTLETYICNKWSFQHSIIVTLRQSCGDGAASVRTRARILEHAALIQLPASQTAASHSLNYMTASENLRA